MNPSQSIANSVGKTLLSQVFNNSQLVNLEEVSDSTIETGNTNTNASIKLQGESRPTFDSTLQVNTAGGLYSKDRTANIFPRLNAEQIARTIDVIEGRLSSQFEFDKKITFNTTPFDGSSYTLIKEVEYVQLLEVPFIAYLIDLKFNDGSELNISTYDKELKVENGYYGEPQNVGYTTYPATADVIKIDGLKQQPDTQVGDGIPGAGLTFIADTPGLLNAIQTEKHIGATVTLRIIFIREGIVLAGPIRGGLLKIDGANHIANPASGTNLITLSTIKTWENINQPHGVRTAAAYLESVFPTGHVYVEGGTPTTGPDGFFKNSRNANISKTFKED